MSNVASVWNIKYVLFYVSECSFQVKKIWICFILVLVNSNNPDTEQWMFLHVKSCGVVFNGSCVGEEHSRPCAY